MRKRAITSNRHTVIDSMPVTMLFRLSIALLALASASVSVSAFAPTNSATSVRSLLSTTTILHQSMSTDDIPSDYQADDLSSGDQTVVVDEDESD